MSAMSLPKIDERMERVDIDSVVLDPANARKHPERNIEAIKGSLARFGQQRPIVVDAAGVVRAGNGTLTAARLLGWKTILIVRTALDGGEAAAFAIADNRTAELAEWDIEALRAVSESVDLTGVFDEHDLAVVLEPWGDGASRIDEIDETGEASPAKITVALASGDRAKALEAIESALDEAGIEHEIK